MQSVLNSWQKAFTHLQENVHDPRANAGLLAQAAAHLVLADRMENTLDLRVEFDNRLDADVSLQGEVDVNATVDQ